MLDSKEKLNLKNKPQCFSGIKLGILGGGQLGKMLIQSANNYNIHSIVLDPDKDAPCKNIATEFLNGSLLDFDSVYNFGKKVDLLTIEIENVNVSALEKLEDEGLKIFPQPSLIKMVQDKGLQKEFYKKNNIPTAEYLLIENKKELMENASFLPAVQKLRKSGYDGRGVKKITSTLCFDNAFNEPSVLEKKIDILKEISIIAARNMNGDISLFPPVELVFKDEANIVDYLFSPANIDSEIKTIAEEITYSLVNSMKIVGLLAVEMFITKEKQILVNEISPRPHNSGHHTIEGNYTSQFEQHLRAILNLPLGDTNIIMPSFMVNILGEEGKEGEAQFKNLNEVLKIPRTYVHLYGKKYSRPNRKMGHITILDENINSGLEKIQFIKENIRVIS